MTTWLHRISHHGEISRPLLEHNYLSIGFSDFAKVPGFIDGMLTQQGWDFLEKVCGDEWGEWPRSRYSLWRFIAEMKTGDRVVVPNSGSFSIYELLEDCALYIGQTKVPELTTTDGYKTQWKDGFLHWVDGGKLELFDLGFVRTVKLIEKEISRSAYCDASLTSRLKVRSTTEDISDLTDSIDKAIDDFRHQRPTNLHYKMLEKHVSPTVKLIQDEINPDKFEQLVKWYFKRSGATTVSIPAKNEPDKVGDADIVAVYEPIKAIIYVQAKHHRCVTDEWAVQQICEYKTKMSTIDDGYAKIAWVISTCDEFSQSCIELAKKHDVMLFDGKAFAILLLEAGISGLDDAMEGLIA